MGLLSRSAGHRPADPANGSGWERRAARVPRFPAPVAHGSCMRNTPRMESNPWLAIPEADRAAWTAFRKAAVGILAELDAALEAEGGIGYSEFDALIQLSCASDGSLRMADLARGISRSPSAATRLVGRLERLGLVRRTSISRTEVRVELTDQGRGSIERLAPSHLVEVRRLFWAPLNARDRRQMGVLASILLDHLRAER